MSYHRDPPRRRRQLSPDEHRLWNGIIRSVAPLRRKRPPALPAEPAPTHDEGSTAPRRRAEPAPLRPAIPKSGPKAAPPIAPLDRRQKQRLARGTDAIDRRIDLHGRTQNEAHAALLGFLRGAQQDGLRFVLVITGKGGFGGDVSSSRGVLKRQVPLWLRLPEFRSYVLSVEDAHLVHGGSGALYVRLRRGRG